MTNPRTTSKVSWWNGDNRSFLVLVPLEMAEISIAWKFRVKCLGHGIKLNEMSSEKASAESCSRWGCKDIVFPTLHFPRHE